MASSTELEELAPHVVYELRAMLAARHLHQVAFAGTFSLEAFLIHVRCLYEFFSRDQPDQRYPKNRYACHYFDPVTEWAATHRPAQPAVFTTDLTDRLQRRLAHLSADALAFVKALPPTRAAWFGGYQTSVADSPFGEGQRAKNRGSEALQAFTEEAHRTGLEYFKAWYATDPDRQLRTIDQLVAECGARAGRGVGGTRARACDRPDSSRN